MRICAVSVDLEEDLADLEQDSSRPKTFRGVESLDRILEVFNEFQIGATLFATGEVLEKYPSLVEKWSVKHEIACHGYYHVALHHLSVAEREKQLEDSCRVYSRILGRNPRGFRAVMHTIDNTQLRLLEKSGFTYDSSVVPIYVPFRKYVGYKGKAPTEPYHPSHDDYREEGEHGILEIPNSPLIFGIPLSGTWIRVLGPGLYKVLLTLKKPAFISLAMHPWDVVQYHGSFSKNTGETFTGYLGRIIRMLAKDYRFMSAGEVASLCQEGNQVSTLCTAKNAVPGAKG